MWLESRPTGRRTSIVHVVVASLAGALIMHRSLVHELLLLASCSLSKEAEQLMPAQPQCDLKAKRRMRLEYHGSTILLQNSKNLGPILPRTSRIRIIAYPSPMIALSVCHHTDVMDSASFKCYKSFQHLRARSRGQQYNDAAFLIVLVCKIGRDCRTTEGIIPGKNRQRQDTQAC